MSKRGDWAHELALALLVDKRSKSMGNVSGMRYAARRSPPLLRKVERMAEILRENVRPKERPENPADNLPTS